MPELIVRPYRDTDRAAVHRIAADTAFFGQPVEAFLEDRQLFCDLLYRYYTDQEPEHGWVSCADTEVVGFLVGCVDTAAYQRRWLRETLPQVVWRGVHSRYRWGPLTWHYLISLIRRQLYREGPSVDLTIYPAHLHINVDARWRGCGLGRRLIEASLEQLRQLEVPGVHLYTTSRNEAACRLYVRMGFRLLGARRTHLWAHLVDQPVETRCYGLELNK